MPNMGHAPCGHVYILRDVPPNMGHASCGITHQTCGDASCLLTHSSWLIRLCVLTFSQSCQHVLHEAANVVFEGNVVAAVGEGARGRALLGELADLPILAIHQIEDL